MRISRDCRPALAGSLLYLAIDREVDRPLIIDQPEENLDPKSFFDEPVERFREARLQRQIIIVTHKAEHFKRGVAPQGRGRDGDGRGATVRLKCVGLNRGPGRRPLWGLNRAVSLKARLGMFGKNEFRGARTNNQGDDGFVRYQRRCRVACEGVDKSVWQRRSGGLVIRANRAQAAGT